ncbi:MAG TPA: acyltransferase family protein [Candidatus Omnitrophota bacterium]|nr:acyltransferase family protein [Candidatus Omnitrophota bacterium]HPD84081.1 acyltransferase family protein [Candidatus Omnitrophota bacterium]HRZ02938.1 acyltransferase family protein [Candidatus Omnitrophota bacterium]
MIKEDRNIIIDVLKGIAIILVVCGHVIQRTMVLNGADFFLNPAFKIIYTFHMPLFFFLSGYLMAWTLGRRSFLDAFKSRCKTLLIPFVVWGMLGVFTIYFLNLIDGKKVSIVHLPQGLFNDLLLIPAVWFLFALFISSCLLIYSVRLAKRLGVAGFFLVYFLVVLLPFNEYGALYYIKWFYLFYLAGYFFNKSRFTITNKITGATILAASLIAFIALVPYWNKNDYIYINKMELMSSDYLYEFMRIAYRYALGFLGIIIVSYAGIYLAKTKLRFPLAYLGIYSLDIYLFQRYIVEGFYPRIASNAGINFDFNSPIFLCGFVPLVAIFFIGVCLLVSRLLIRRIPLLGKLLLGNRT